MTLIFGLSINSLRAEGVEFCLPFDPEGQDMQALELQPEDHNFQSSIQARTVFLISPSSALHQRVGAGTPLGLKKKKKAVNLSKRKIHGL